LNPVLTHLQSGVLDNGRVVKSDSCAPVATPSDDDNDRPTNNNQTLTDDALFNACGGRTAHKCVGRFAVSEVKPVSVAVFRAWSEFFFVFSAPEVTAQW